MHVDNVQLPSCRVDNIQLHVLAGQACSLSLICMTHAVLHWACCAVLCCAVLCCAVLCCAVLCCAVLCCAVLCCAHNYVLQAAAEVAHAADVAIWFEPVSVPKSVRASKVLGLLTYISPNAHELIAMALAVDPTHNADLAQQLLLQMAAGSQIPAVGQLKLLTPFLLSVLKVG